MIQAGLVLEGGGMKGIYTAGALDFFLDKGIEFSSVQLFIKTERKGKRRFPGLSAYERVLRSAQPFDYGRSV